MMKTYIVFLRGINVGGHKKVPMVELRELLTKNGFENVKTYIQSGNIILQSSKKNTTKIEQLVQQSIQSYFGFEVSVIAKTRKELQTIFDDCPFSKEKKENSYFVLLSDAPKEELVQLISDKSYDKEEFIILNDCLYFYSSIGYGRTKFNMNSFEKKLNVNATSRNFKTIDKLLELSL